MNKINIFKPNALYGIIGYPLGHSLSPLLHNYIFTKANISAVYMSFAVPKGKLPDFVKALQVLPIRGVSVTIPHKEDIIPFLDIITPQAKKAGAVNTIFWDEQKLCGANTDIAGFMQPLNDFKIKEKVNFSTALVLGAGGAARAVLCGLTADFCGEIFITNRNKAKAEILAAEFNVKIVDWDNRAQIAADLIINTTPLGLIGEHINVSPYPCLGFTKHRGLAYDLIYNPLRTRFLKEAQEAGWATISGMDMFLAQGFAQLKLWFGQDFDSNDARSFIYENSYS